MTEDMDRHEALITLRAGGWLTAYRATFRDRVRLHNLYGEAISHIHKRSVIRLRKRHKEIGWDEQTPGATNEWHWAAGYKIVWTAHTEAEKNAIELKRLIHK